MHAKIRRVGRVSLVYFVLTAGIATAAEPDRRLAAAAKAQNRPSVQALLKQGVDVNTPMPDGSTALLWAAHWDDAESVDLLLRADANVNAADDQGVTPLILACENADATMVGKLLAAGADATRAQANGVTPLMMAARTGDVTIVKALLARGAGVNAAIPDTGQTALMWATSEGHADVMRELIATGANVHAQSKIGFTPFLFAARNGDIDAAKILIGAGAGVDEAGADATHALPLAVVSGHDAFAMFLLDHGANPNTTMAGVTALHAAAGSVDMWLRDWFRARGVDYFRSTVRYTPSRRVALVKALLARGADPNARIGSSTVVYGFLTLKRGAFEPFSVGTGDLKGATPLWVAAFDMHEPPYSFGAMDTSGSTERPEIVRALLAAGADWRLTTVDKTTPLMVAAGLGHGTYLPGKKRGDPTPDAEATVKILVEARADVNVTNEAGFTALHGAAFKGLNEVVQFLVEHHANINAQDFMGRTPFRLAEGSKQTFQFQEWPETAELLKHLGADTDLGVPGKVQERQREIGAKAATKQQ